MFITSLVSVRCVEVTERKQCKRVRFDWPIRRTSDMRALVAAAVVTAVFLASPTESHYRQRLRTRHLKTNRQLHEGEYRLMRAPKIVNGIKKTRIGDRVVGREGITVKVSDDGTIGVNVDANVDVDISVGEKTESEINDESNKIGELECIEWETIYVLASSKSSKSSGKSGKGSKGGKSSKSAGKSTKMIPVMKCVAYETQDLTNVPTTEPVPVASAEPIAMTPSVSIVILK